MVYPNVRLTSSVKSSALAAAASSPADLMTIHKGSKYNKVVSKRKSPRRLRQTRLEPSKQCEQSAPPLSEEWERPTPTPEISGFGTNSRSWMEQFVIRQGMVGHWIQQRRDVLQTHSWRWISCSKYGAARVLREAVYGAEKVVTQLQ